MRITRLTWLAVAGGAAVLALGCGEGHAIFDIDVLSFLGGQGNDTVHYTIPGGTAGSVDNPPVRVTLLKGLGNSTVDSVTLTVAASVENPGRRGQSEVPDLLCRDTGRHVTPALPTPRTRRTSAACRRRCSRPARFRWWPTAFSPRIRSSSAFGSG